jgi:hypothetical protein
MLTNLSEKSWDWNYAVLEIIQCCPRVLLMQHSTHEVFRKHMYENRDTSCTGNVAPITPGAPAKYQERIDNNLYDLLEHSFFEKKNSIAFGCTSSTCLTNADNILYDMWLMWNFRCKSWDVPTILDWFSSIWFVLFAFVYARLQLEHSR